MFDNHTTLVAIYYFDSIKITGLPESFIEESDHTIHSYVFWFTKKRTGSYGSFVKESNYTG